MFCQVKATTCLLSQWFHVSLDQGSYLFIESSAPRSQGDVAGLVSHNMPAGRDVCISLWYYMYGDGIGTLRVLIKVKHTIRT
jgi:hypothetical protein